MKTKIRAAELTELRSRVDTAREAVRRRDANTSDISDLDSVRRVTFSAMSELMDGARDAGRDLRADEARTYDSLESILRDASDLLEDARAQQPREPLVFGTRTGEGDDPELRRAFESYLRTGEAGELRALGVSTDASGGYAAPAGFRSKVSETLAAHGGVRSVATVVPTSDGADLPWVAVDDTANEGTGVQAEHSVVADQDVTFGQRQLGSYMYPSGIVKVSIQLVQDNVIDLETRLARWLGQRIHRKQSGHFATGTGTGQPQGLVTGTAVGKTGATGQTTSVTYDDLVDVLHGVDPAYRENPDECAWLMNDQTFAAVRKLKDADGRPLVEPDVKRGAPNSILGFRVAIDQGFPSMAASAKPIVFGNIKAGYVIRDVRAVEVVRFSERYMDALQVGFLAFLRSDGMVDDGDAVKAYQNSAT
jgi:HK97 family phage major capsid protein